MAAYSFIGWLRPSQRRGPACGPRLCSTFCSAFCSRAARAPDTPSAPTSWGAPSRKTLPASDDRRNRSGHQPGHRRSRRTAGRPRTRAPRQSDVRRARRPPGNRRRPCGRRHHPLVRHPGIRAAHRAARLRPDRPGADRHRQDPRLRRSAARPRDRPGRGGRRLPAGTRRGADPRAGPPGRPRHRRGRQDPRRAGPARSTAGSPTSRRSTRSPRAWRSSSAPPAACSTWPRASSSSSTASAPSCSTRPTGCSTSGFLDDVEQILAMLPDERQTMLFSATMPDPIVTLARRFLRHPMTIHAHHDATTGPSPLTQQVGLPHPPDEQDRGRGADPSGRASGA